MPHQKQPRICVFCGSADGADPVYLQTARELGERIASEGMGLVYGGATVGLMGVLANAAIAGGAEVIGVMPDVLMDREIAHPGITHFHVVKTMHERKALMYEHADAFIALPGGYGTLDEFIEIVTWAQLKIHQKPCILINTNGYYDGFLAFLDHAMSQGFLKPENRKLIDVAPDAEAALAIVETVWKGHPTKASHDEKLDELIKG
jgi:uncharacterized protein (TIGR00730 family)